LRIEHDNDVVTGNPVDVPEIVGCSFALFWASLHAIILTAIPNRSGDPTILHQQSIWLYRNGVFCQRFRVRYRVL